MKLTEFNAILASAISRSVADLQAADLAPRSLERGRLDRLGAGIERDGDRLLIRVAVEARVDVIGEDIEVTSASDRGIAISFAVPIAIPLEPTPKDL